MSIYVVPQELAGLPGMPSTERNCLTKLNKLAEGLLNKKRSRDFGKGFEYHVSLLPKETREALMLRRVMGSAPASVDEPRVVEGDLLLAGDRSWDELNDRQRDCASARLAFVREVERMSQIMSQAQAIRHLVQLSTEGKLPERLADLVSTANDKGRGVLSSRSLERWISQFKVGGQIALAPAKKEASMRVPGWWAVFAPFWQKPQKPSMAEAYRDYVDETPGPHASEHQVRYFMETKLSEEARNWGRMSDQELKAHQAFKRLSFDHLDPNDIWQIDGHKFDAQVINPITGQSFRPEVTVIIDWATRVWVGFSINLAESSISTVDAIRDAVASRGMFTLLYTDNGPGFKDNALVDRVCDVLGGTLTRALPYNSQAKGLVERFHKTALVRLAKKYPSYIGADMDKQAGTKAHKISLALLKEGTHSEFEAHTQGGDPHQQYALDSMLGDAAHMDVGTTGGTVASGDHLHAQYELKTNLKQAAYKDVGSGADQVAAGNHAHAAGDVGAAPISHTHTAAQGNQDIVVGSYGQVGTYGFLHYHEPPEYFYAGQTAPGSTLYWASASGDTSGTPSGTWKCLGHVNRNDSHSESTLWIRIA